MAAAAVVAAPATARKTLFTTTTTLLSPTLTRSSLRDRSISCSAAAPPLAPQPPDLIRWVQREGGFVHPALRVTDHPEHRLGVSAAATDGDIPPGDVLISLPGRLPLRLRRPTSAADDLLVQLAQQVPDNHRDWSEETGGYQIWDELSLSSLIARACLKRRDGGQ